jgi:hypothetical protein
MNRGISAWQWGHARRSAADGAITISPSQDRHWKWIFASITSVLPILWISGALQAQSIADAARQERQRQANLKAAHVVTPSGPVQVQEPKAADSTSAVQGPQKEEPKKPSKPAVDPAEAWNKQLEELRTKVRALQDRELDLLMRQNETTNQVYAPVTDPASQERAQAQLADIQQQLAAVRKDLDEARKKLTAMQAQGPPKK